MNHSKSQIMVVDDDPQLLRDVEVYLDAHGFGVATAKDGASALGLAETAEPDLVVLDINFPPTKASRSQQIDGIEVLRRLREAYKVPILMLSSTNISSVKVMALTIGADDYMPKPFDMAELGARIDAILRRSRGEDPVDAILTFRHLKLDPGERRAWKDGVTVDLTGAEFDILYVLARRPNQVFTREKLLQQAWQDPRYSIPKAIDVHIGHIRKKIEDKPNKPTIIVTVRGTGYRFEDVPA